MTLKTLQEELSREFWKRADGSATFYDEELNKVIEKAYRAGIGAVEPDEVHIHMDTLVEDNELAKDLRMDRYRSLIAIDEYNRKKAIALNLK